MAKYTEMVLNGHGGWNLKQNPAWAQVPRGTTIKFLTGNMELLLAQDISDQETAERLLQQFRTGDINQEGEEYKYVPNYTLSPHEVSGGPDWVYEVGSATALCDNDGSDPKAVCDSGIHRCTGVFADPDLIGATLYWAACRYVALKDAGGSAVGVNQYGERRRSDDEIQAMVDELLLLPADEQEARFVEIGGSMYDADAVLGPADFQRFQELYQAP